MKVCALKYLLAGGVLLAARPAVAQIPVLELEDASSFASGLEMVPPATGAAPAAGAKYRNLLRKIEVPADRASYGEFYDWGHWSGTSWAGHNDLPPGYWVYVDGWWYIFGESGQDAPPTYTSTDTVPVETAWSAKGRAWGPEQATGAPDTPQAGDIQTAWASVSQDDQAEWLELTFDAPLDAVAAMIHESYNPGAVTKVSIFDAEGNEHVVYEAAAEILSPQPAVDVLILGGIEKSDAAAIHVGVVGVAGQQRRTLVLPIVAGFATQKVKVYLDSAAVPGWNEIDAVGLIDSAGNTQWASGATASSTYADRIEQNVNGEMTGTIDLILSGTPEERGRQLEEEVRRLQQEIEQLRGNLGSSIRKYRLQSTLEPR